MEALEKLSAADAPDFLAVATPGAGKTTFALTAALQHLTIEPTCRVVVVAPTSHLKSQWSQAANRLGLHLDPEWSARDGSLPGDMHGIVTSYQQVAGSAAALSPLAAGAFVVFDEIHHAGDDRSWGSAVLKAFGGASRRLALSGTPFRSDTSAIPFVDYHLDEARPDFEYDYGDALADRGVVRPVYFPRIGGFMEWVTPEGDVLAATFDDELARERSNQRLRTALSLEGQWLPEVLEQADMQLDELRRHQPDAAGLVIATDQEHARGIAELLRRRVDDVVLVTSDEPSASERIEAFAAGAGRWIVAVRMVSEGVDIPRLRVAVYATTTSTELFFRQAVGRVVRWQPGQARQKAFVFIPDDPRLAGHAARITEARRHSLRRRAERETAVVTGFDDPSIEGDDAEQLSMFAVIGSVALDADQRTTDGATADVFGDDPEDTIGVEPAGVEVVVFAPPPPGSSEPVSSPSASGETEGLTLRQRKRRVRDANAELVLELVRGTGWGHAQVNRELNRLSGIDRVSEATLAQLERRLLEGRRWLRRR